MAKTIRLILGDQLNENHSWYEEVDDEVIYTLMEIRPESEYVTHHIQKIVGIFLGMRTFAEWLRRAGHQVKYWKITDDENEHDFIKNIKTLIDEASAELVEYQEPDEWRLDRLLAEGLSELDIEHHMVSSEHFYTERAELEEMFRDKKSYLMETFYRKMRQQHDVLMDDGDPVSGKWNYDKENRKKLPNKITVPQPRLYSHDVSDILSEINEAGLDSIGHIDESAFIWPKNRKEALEVLEYFVSDLLDGFGTYQDAMSVEEWSVFHCRLSFAMNTKMISPREVVDAVERAYFDREGDLHLSHVEGFIRQILGWREYMRGLYWAKMPDYAEQNHFGHDRALPSYYWTGDTQMKCLSCAISQSLDYSYAHHIQRLMVTGNFALLTGVDPDEVDQWYLGIYIDAFEWVEITNTRGMSQYADGGIVGTKPYVSSGSYINKMSDYCRSCHYDHKEKVGDKACPFNSLYWNFLDRHRDKLSNNPRMSMMYRVWDKMDNQEELLQQAKYYLDHIEEL